MGNFALLYSKGSSNITSCTSFCLEYLTLLDSEYKIKKPNMPAYQIKLITINVPDLVHVLAIEESNLHILSYGSSGGSTFIMTAFLYSE